MKASDNDGRSVSHRLANFLLSYRATPHATTNRSPSSLFLNRTLRTRFSLLYPNTEQHVTAVQADQVLQHDQHAKTRNFQIDQQVMVRNLRPSGPKWTLGKIIKQTGPLSYIGKVHSGLEWKCHVDHIRDYQPAITGTESNNDDYDLPGTESNEQTDPSSHRYPTRTRVPPDRFM